MKSKAKGKRGELAAVDYLKSLGFVDARRTQQYNGIGLGDVVCPDSLPHVHIEVKVGGRLDVDSQRLRDACKQAERDADGKAWCVLWKPDRKQWRLTCAVPRVLTATGDESVCWCLLHLNGGVK